MNIKEISTQEICKIMKMSPSYFAQKRIKYSLNFPQSTRTGGVTNSAEFYDRKEFMDWLENYQLEKILKKKTDTNKLICAFLGGFFDRSALKDVYKCKAIRAKLNKPKTQKIHVDANYDEINWNRNFWGGVI